MIWNAIKNQVCDTAADRRYEAYLTKRPVAFVINGRPENRHWVIGPYESLKKLARDLRVDATTRASFGQACFGRRHTDLPPTGPQPSGGFRTAIAGAVPNPINPALLSMRQVDANPTPRRSDLYGLFADFYAKKTLEAHHVVEKSILGDLGRNKGDLRDDIAPCVLVVAELHQQIYTPEVSKFRTSFSPAMSSQAQAALLNTIYEDLYAPAQMADLLAIVRIIVSHVKLGQPT